MQENLEFIVYKDNGKRAQPEAETQMNNQLVNLSGGRWGQEAKQACPLVAEWRVQQLRIFQNGHKSIIKQIESIRFPNLRLLAISANSIQSIEGLSRMVIPQLSQVYIGENNILNIRSIKKLMIPSLSWVNIRNNPIKDVKELCWLKSPEIKAIHIENTHDPQLESNLNWAVKLETRDLETLGILSKERITSYECWDCLKRRFEHVKIRGQKL